MDMLNRPITVGKIILNNRLVMPPMATAKSGSDGKVTDALCKYYEEKSHGGYIGLIITEHSFISPEGKASNGQLSISSDDDIVGLHKLTDIIHKNKTKVFAQISHAGGATTKDITGYTPLSASSYVHPHKQDSKAIEMTHQDIEIVIADFAAAAKRSKEAGFDGVEIHSAHAYLLNQFYSPLINKRTDEYTGATLEGRTKLHLEVIHAVRKAVGENYPIALRLGACDYMEGGTTIEDSIKAAILFEKAGIDLLDISGGFCFYTNPKDKSEGYFRELTHAIKQAVNIPVILTGGIVTKNSAEHLLQMNDADLIGIGRAILKNSNWAKDVMS